MKKILKIIGILLLVLIIVYIVYIHTLRNYFFYSSQIEIQIPLFAKMEEKDTHGGFHGDGEAFLKVNFSDKQAEKFVNKINQNNHWKKLPMPERLQNRVSNADEVEAIPIVKNGYWFFEDRHAKATDKYNYNEIFDSNRASLNFSVAVFDTDANILYFYALDT